MKSKVYLLTVIILITVATIFLVSKNSQKNDLDSRSNIENQRSDSFNVNLDLGDSFILSEDSDGARSYTNTVYHYQITLPEDWQLDQNSYDELMMFRDQKLLEQDVDTLDIIQGMKLEIYVLKKDNNQDLDQLISRSYGGATDSMISRENKTINGFESVQVIDDFMGYSMGTYFDRGSVIILVNGIVGNEDHQEYTDKYKNILSTFKFID